MARRAHAGLLSPTPTCELYPPEAAMNPPPPLTDRRPWYTAPVLVVRTYTPSTHIPVPTSWNRTYSAKVFGLSMRGDSEFGKFTSAVFFFNFF